ncbi:MAG: response regulator [Chloroflexi bacterium]|nr:response regulator [Chloroflexota bacterium]MBI3762176.1 response regulator [Chloroflexota bacterium]
MAERKIILSIEDDPDIAHLIQLVLRNAPAEVLTAGRADEAIALIEHRRLDLILLDLMLPQMNGLDLLESLQQEGRIVGVPVIIVSVRTDTAQRHRAQELGVEHYVLKPFSPAKLREEIEGALGVDWREYW